MARRGFDSPLYPPAWGTQDDAPGTVYLGSALIAPTGATPRPDFSALRFDALNNLARAVVHDDVALVADLGKGGGGKAGQDKHYK